MRFGFVGRSYRSQSPNVAADRVVNLYPEKVEGGGKTELAFYPTPGLAKFCVLPTGPIRGILFQNTRCFAVGGPTLYELHETGTYTTRGHVGTDDASSPVSLCGNGYGHQLFIVSAGSGYVLDLLTHTLTKVLDDMATIGGFIDSYFVALDVPNKRLRVSDPENGLVWGGTMVKARATSGDDWAGMAISHREIHLWGGQTMEVYYNDGQSEPPFTMRPGADSDLGIVAPYSACATGNTVIWLGGDAEGHGVVYMSIGYQPQAISDKGVEYAIQSYGTISDATGWSYQDQGHTFYVLSFPTERATWVYDLTTGMWHERNFWNAPVQREDAYRPSCHAFAWGAHLVGDRETGDVYEMSVAFPLDVNEQRIRRVRQTPHVCSAQTMLFHTRVQIDLEAGLGTVAASTMTGRLISAAGFAGPTPPTLPVVAEPALALSWSDDNGHTWSDERAGSTGTRGQRQARVIFRQLGRSRDRIYRLVLTDPAPWRIVDAYLEATAGSQ